eukprot:109891-Amphidinium_carterae.1
MLTAQCKLWEKVWKAEKLHISKLWHSFSQQCHRCPVSTALLNYKRDAAKPGFTSRLCNHLSIRVLTS